MVRERSTVQSCPAAPAFPPEFLPYGMRRSDERRRFATRTHARARHGGDTDVAGSVSIAQSGGWCENFGCSEGRRRCDSFWPSSEICALRIGLRAADRTAGPLPETEGDGARRRSTMSTVPARRRTLPGVGRQRPIDPEILTREGARWRDETDPDYSRRAGHTRGCSCRYGRRSVIGRGTRLPKPGTRSSDAPASQEWDRFLLRASDCASLEAVHASAGRSAGNPDQMSDKRPAFGQCDHWKFD